MKGIDRIVHLRHPGVLHDFTWPADLPDFGRYNLIYGWNGSGKTIISRLFRDLEMRTPPSNYDVTLYINGANIHGTEFGQATLPARVFNREFITESVFPIGGGDVHPIFVVGKESVEKQKEIERLKKDLVEAEAQLRSKSSKNNDADKTLDRYCIAQATVIRETLRSSGSNPYNNYDKSDFRERAQKMEVDGEKGIHGLSDSDREKLIAQHQANPKPKVQSLAYSLLDFASLVDDVTELLDTTVVSTTIQALKDDSELSAWVHHGLGLHHDRNANKCLFCDQEMPKDRLAAIEAHFTAEYEHFLKKLDDKIEECQLASQATATVVMPNRAELYEDLAADYEQAENSLRKILESTTTFLDSLIHALKEKKSRVFEQLTLKVAVPVIATDAVKNLNEVIQKHNQACDDFQARRSKARERLRDHFINSNLDEFSRLRDAVQTSVTAVKQADTQVKGLKADIARLEREIVEHRRPAEELNEDLHKYLGHNELCLEIKDTGYAITRNGAPAYSLSEGETTAIALLYFLKSLQDRRFDLSSGAVVLDDPVSSLDANALYLAFGFIRERAQDAAQIFIFTHNFTFFRQVRNWFHHLKGQNRKQIKERPARFYMLECYRSGDQRCSTLRPLDPLLEQYESEYHYLFARIYQAATASVPTALDQNYIFPNMARRLVEAFLAFRQPQVAGELWQKFEHLKFDDAKKFRILRFLHTHSHSDAIVEPEHDPSLLGEARSVLYDLMELIKDQDPQHYEAMVRLINPPSEEEDQG